MVNDNGESTMEDVPDEVHGGRPGPAMGGRGIAWRAVPKETPAMAGRGLRNV